MARRTGRTPTRRRLRLAPHVYVESRSTPGLCACCPLPRANQVHAVAVSAEVWDVAQLAAGEVA